MKVTIVSPEKTLYQGESDCVVVPGENGLFEVLHNHAPIISSLTTGTVTCKGAEPFAMDIRGGFIEVANNEISICVEY